MSLSKKNLDKLNTFVKNKNLLNNKNIETRNSKDKIHNEIKNSSNLEDANKIFYSLIDNSETLEETSEANKLLRNIEKNCINPNSNKTNYSKYLTTEDELYDEFNYLLEE